MASFLHTRRSPNHPTQCTTYSLQQQQSFHSIQTIHGDKNTGSWQQTACIEFYLYGMFPSLNVPIILSLYRKSVGKHLIVYLANQRLTHVFAHAVPKAAICLCSPIWNWHIWSVTNHFNCNLQEHIAYSLYAASFFPWHKLFVCRINIQ